MNDRESQDVILNDLRGVLHESLGVDPLSPIGRETRFFADLGLASIDAVVLGEAIQQRLRRRLPFDRLMAEVGRRARRDLTIGELVAFIEENP